MKNILVPTDFSECASYATNVAMKLAKKSKAKIRFLHIVEAPVEWNKLPKEKEKNFPETLHAIGIAKAEMGKLIRKATKDGLDAKESIVFNSTSDEIIKQAKKGKHDFIVMGTHGASGVREIFLGSNVQKIIRHSPVPVLTVKTKQSRFDVKDIVIASKFDKKSAKGLDVIIDFTKFIGAKPHLLFVNTPADFQTSSETTENIWQYKSHCPSGTTFSVENALTVEEGILNYISYNKGDMVAVVTEGRTGLKRLFSHSISEAVANHAECPVLSVHK